MATEKRLIDANAFLDEALKRYTERERGRDLLYTACEVKQNLADMICEAPTVDAVELPCKIGDKVYRIDKGDYHSNWKPFVQELTVTEISWKKGKYGDKDLGFAIIADGIRYKFTTIGKSVFLTRKEAEAKMDGDGNG
jgi:hypothetical protein